MLSAACDLQWNELGALLQESFKLAVWPATPKAATISFADFAFAC